MTIDTIQIYESSAEHLFAELQWLNCLVEREIQRFRGRAPGEGHPDLFQGLYISDQQVDRLITEPSESEAKFMPPLDNAEALREEVDQRRAASMERETPLMLSVLARLFGLSAFEERLVLVALAPEVDSRFGTLYAYLQDEITRRRATVDLALRMLCDSPEQRLRAMKALSHNSRLYQMGILRMPDKHTDELLRQRALILDNSIVDFLLETGGMDTNVAACFQRTPGGRPLNDLRWRGELTSQVIGADRQLPARDYTRECSTLFPFLWSRRDWKTHSGCESVQGVSHTAFMRRSERSYSALR